MRTGLSQVRSHSGSLISSAASLHRVLSLPFIGKTQQQKASTETAHFLEEKMGVGRMTPQHVSEKAHPCRRRTADALGTTPPGSREGGAGQAGRCSASCSAQGARRGPAPRHREVASSPSSSLSAGPETVPSEHSYKHTCVHSRAFLVHAFTFPPQKNRRTRLFPSHNKATLNEQPHFIYYIF